MVTSVSRRIRIALSIGAAAATVVSLAPTAMAAPGEWQQLSTFTTAATRPAMGNIDLPTIAHFGAQTQVIWSGSNAAGKSTYYTALLDGAGNVTTVQTPILDGWDALTSNPRLTTVAGNRFLFFSGLGAAYPGAELYATSTDGLTWTVGPGSLSASNSAYAAYGNDGLDNAGTPVWAGEPGTTNGIVWHAGIAPTIPAPAGSDGVFTPTGCCGYDAALARDTTSGAVYAAFYSNSGGTAEKGINVGQILPTLGAFTQAPGNVITNEYGVNAPGVDQRIPLVARPGGGVYVAYPMGYPFVSGVRIWHVGTTQTLDLPNSDNAGRITMSADASGRLWVSYIKDHKLRVVHTNPAATALGSTGTWGAPAGTADIWHSASSAGDGTVDVVITSNANGGAINVWHMQANRTLTISGTPSPVNSGNKVTFKVTDAGAPVAGATVTFAGHTGTTNGSGKVKLTASGHGTKVAKAKKSGFNQGSTSIRVR